ncbi:succinate--CoA ligase subunit beta [Candidatus Legionella polyplacis]|uniref:ADP-forming succinate--CoA ligase subunit beta n=1 Tax=Candidatus Legionella polyplacis TaxID=2005262 RepID=UPI000C1DD225|nr:ADP-forming succinate--CoA ligase subunit beta [Candidatus Legionella polyplacis]ATW01913.1 succinate--CoA ligase subunit beta [Candidatus Legionella polyplacis]
MNLHEYQSKQLFVSFGLKVPIGKVVFNVDEALLFISKYNHILEWVIKAQIHSGERGKNGGVKFTSNNKMDIVNTINSLLHKKLSIGKESHSIFPVEKILLEEKIGEINKEFYLGITVDNFKQKIILMVSDFGGMDIEESIKKDSGKIFKFCIDPFLRIMPFQLRSIAFKLGLKDELLKNFVFLIEKVSEMFFKYDLSLLEINPLVLTNNNEYICLDGKIRVDDNALYRQSYLKGMRDIKQEDYKESWASKWNLNYISLNGNIGCMVNGAGLAMATMDMIKFYGGVPANFLDVGGSVTRDQVVEACKIIFSDKRIKGVLINIFGGIVRCDIIADGIIFAIKNIYIDIPIVIRLNGNNSNLAFSLLKKFNFANVISFINITDAIRKIVNLTM